MHYCLRIVNAKSLKIPPVECSSLWGGVEGVMLVRLICSVEQQRRRLTGAKPAVRSTKCGFFLFCFFFFSYLAFLLVCLPLIHPGEIQFVSCTDVHMLRVNAGM